MSFKPSKFYDFTVPANGSYVLTVAGDYFKVMSSTGPISIKADWGELRGLIAGQGLEDSPFARLFIANDTGVDNVVRLFIGDEKFIDGLSGSVNVLGGSMTVVSTVPPVSALDNQAKTVTNASAQLLAAKTGRKYLLVQNKDDTGTIYLSFGKAATVANGVKVGPGGFFEMDASLTDQAIFAIGSIANNTNITTVEG